MKDIGAQFDAIAEDFVRGVYTVDGFRKLLRQDFGLKAQTIEKIVALHRHRPRPPPAGMSLALMMAYAEFAFVNGLIPPEIREPRGGSVPSRSPYYPLKEPF